MENNKFNQTPKKLPKYITQSEISMMLERAKKESYRNYILLLLLSRTGLRVGEVVNLRKCDIMNGNVMVLLAKGMKDRVVPIEKELGNILGLYCDTMRPKQKLFDLTDRQVRNIVYRYATHGLNVHPHTLRHSFAVHCLLQGMNIRNLQKILGHSNLTTTQIYLDVTGEDIKDDFEKIKW
jgi:site-specific recombinase XerD